MPKRRKRKRCLNCRHGDVCRWGDEFPRYAFCLLDDPPPGDDPRDWLHSTDTTCEKWKGQPDA